MAAELLLCNIVQGSTSLILFNFCAKIRHIAKPRTVTFITFDQFTVIEKFMLKKLKKISTYFKIEDNPLKKTQMPDWKNNNMNLVLEN